VIDFPGEREDDMEWMICLDEGGNAEGPEFDGPRDERVWSLYSQDRHIDVGGTFPRPVVTGPHYGELGMYRYASGMSYTGAENLARWIGIEGSPVGGVPISS
jgi:hypothetical protein